MSNSKSNSEGISSNGQSIINLRDDVWIGDTCMICRTVHSSDSEKLLHINKDEHKKRLCVYDFLRQSLSMETMSSEDSVLFQRYKKSHSVAVEPLCGEQFINLGLECIQEFIVKFSNERLWVCTICYSAGCCLDTVDDHLNSFKHQQIYFEEFYPNYISATDLTQPYLVNELFDIGLRLIKEEGDIKLPTVVRLSSMDKSETYGKLGLPGNEEATDVDYILEQCSEHHTVVHCKVCGNYFVCKKEMIRYNWQIHLEKPKHQRLKTIASFLAQVDYDLCHSPFRELKVDSEDSAMFEWLATTDYFCYLGTHPFCSLCYTLLNSLSFAEHFKSEKHIMNYLVSKIPHEVHHLTYLPENVRCKKEQVLLNKVVKTFGKGSLKDVRKYRILFVPNIIRELSAADSYGTVESVLPFSCGRQLFWCSVCGSVILLSSLKQDAFDEWCSHCQFSKIHLDAAARFSTFFYDKANFINMVTAIKYGENEWKTNWESVKYGPENTTIFIQKYVNVGLDFIIEDRDRRQVVCTLCGYLHKFEDAEDAFSLHIRSMEHLMRYLFATNIEMFNLVTALETVEDKKSLLMDYLQKCFVGTGNPLVFSTFLSSKMLKWGSVPYRKVEICAATFSIQPIYGLLLDIIDTIADDNLENFPISVKESLEVLHIKVHSFHDQKVLFWCERCEQGFTAFEKTVIEAIWNVHLKKKSHDQRLLSIRHNSLGHNGYVTDISKFRIPESFGAEKEQALVYTENDYRFTHYVVGVSGVIERRSLLTDTLHHPDLYCLLCLESLHYGQKALDEHIRSLSHIINYVHRHHTEAIFTLDDLLETCKLDGGHSICKFLVALLKSDSSNGCNSIRIYDPNQVINQTKKSVRKNRHAKRLKYAKDLANICDEKDFYGKRRKSSKSSFFCQKPLHSSGEACSKHRKSEKLFYSNGLTKRDLEIDKKERRCKEQIEVPTLLMDGATQILKNVRKTETESKINSENCGLIQEMKKQKNKDVLNKNPALEASKNKCKEKHQLRRDSDTEMGNKSYHLEHFKQHRKRYDMHSLRSTSHSQRRHINSASKSSKKIRLGGHRGSNLDELKPKMLEAITTRELLVEFMWRQGSEPIVQDELPKAIKKFVAEGNFLGLKSVYQVVCYDKPSFLSFYCSICCYWCTTCQLFIHLLTTKHRMSYLSQDYGKYYKRVINQPNVARRMKVLDNVVRKIMKLEGQSEVKYRLRCSLNYATITRLWPEHGEFLEEDRIFSDSLNADNGMFSKRDKEVPQHVDSSSSKVGAVDIGKIKGSIPISSEKNVRKECAIQNEVIMPLDSLHEKLLCSVKKRESGEKLSTKGNVIQKNKCELQGDSGRRCDHCVGEECKGGELSPEISTETDRNYGPVSLKSTRKQRGSLSSKCGSEKRGEHLDQESLEGQNHRVSVESGGQKHWKAQPQKGTFKSEEGQISRRKRRHCHFRSRSHSKSTPNSVVEELSDQHLISVSSIKSTLTRSKKAESFFRNEEDSVNKCSKAQSPQDNERLQRDTDWTNAAAKFLTKIGDGKAAEKLLESIRRPNKQQKLWKSADEKHFDEVLNAENHKKQFGAVDSFLTSNALDDNETTNSIECQQSARSSCSESENCHSFGTGLWKGHSHLDGKAKVENAVADLLNILLQYFQNGNQLSENFVTNLLSAIDIQPNNIANDQINGIVDQLRQVFSSVACAQNCKSSNVVEHYGTDNSSINTAGGTKIQDYSLLRAYICDANETTDNSIHSTECNCCKSSDRDLNLKYSPKNQILKQYPTDSCICDTGSANNSIHFSRNSENSSENLFLTTEALEQRDYAGDNNSNLNVQNFQNIFSLRKGGYMAADNDVVNSSSTLGTNSETKTGYQKIRCSSTIGLERKSDKSIICCPDLNMTFSNDFYENSEKCEENSRRYGALSFLNSPLNKDDFQSGNSLCGTADDCSLVFPNTYKKIKEELTTKNQGPSHQVLPLRQWLNMPISDVSLIPSVIGNTFTFKIRDATSSSSNANLSLSNSCDSLGGEHNFFASGNVRTSNICVSAWEQSDTKAFSAFNNLPQTAYENPTTTGDVNNDEAFSTDEKISDFVFTGIPQSSRSSNAVFLDDISRTTRVL